MNTRHLLLAAALALGAPAAGCMTDSPDEYTPNAPNLPRPAKSDWSVSDPFRCETFDVLWEVAKGKASANGFRLDDDETTFKNRRIISTWKIEMGVMKNDGKRRRRYVEFEEVKDMKNMWRVKVATVKQRNVDMDSPLDPKSAEWKKDEPDTDDSDRVVYLIAAQFSDFGPSREFEKK